MPKGEKLLVTAERKHRIYVLVVSNISMTLRNITLKLMFNKVRNIF